jgi:hypothetical protein
MSNLDRNCRRLAFEKYQGGLVAYLAKLGRRMLWSVHSSVCKEAILSVPRLPEGHFGRGIFDNTGLMQAQGKAGSASRTGVILVNLQSHVLLMDHISVPVLGTNALETVST